MSDDLTGGSSPVRILVVDDHPAVRQGLSLLVGPEGMELCVKAGSRTEALRVAEECRPNLAIVDLSLENEDGLPIVSALTALGMPVLVYSMHSDASHVRGAFTAGALGYVTKLEFDDVLLEAIHSVSAGQRFVSPRAGAALSAGLDNSKEQSAVESLSDKERQVFGLLGKGEGTHEIAARMNISTNTVASYYSRIQVKLGVEGMYELRRLAIEFLRSHPY